MLTQNLGAAVIAPPDSRTRTLAQWWQRADQVRRAAIAQRRSRQVVPSMGALASLTAHDFHAGLGRAR
jgi:hypothetical protein